MMEIIKTTEEGLCSVSLDKVESGSWIRLIKPNADELSKVENLTKAPQDFIRAAMDPEESSRIEIEDNEILILINVPLNHKSDSRSDPEEYDTIPLGIIVTPDYFVTVCQEENKIFASFTESRYRYFSTFKRTRFLFQILYRSAVLFLKDLRQITRHSDQIELDLRKSMMNREIFQLLDLQKGLTYYSMSLRSNRVVIERLLRLCSNPQVSHIIKIREEDEDLLDDVRVEYDQSVEMAQIQTEVLAGMMDTMASVISNNLNIVMKFLASVTIVLAIPTMISGFFGMNVTIPWQHNPMGFYIVCFLAIVLTFFTVYVLWRKKLF